MVNLDGHVARFDLEVGGEDALVFLVDVTGGPTGLCLRGHGKSEVVENEAFRALARAVELDAYRYRGMSKFSRTAP